MTRVLLLSCSLATFAACDVGDVPEKPEPDGPGVICEQAGINGDGHHNAGMDCMMGGCHTSTDVGAVAGMKMGGTVFQAAADTEGKGTATIIVEWGTPVMSEKYVTATGPIPTAFGNFYADEEQLVGITFPATVKVSLCPDPEKVMLTKINNAGDLACSKGGCHGNGTAKIFIK